MKARKFFALILLITVFAVALAGCGGENDSKGSKPAVTEDGNYELTFATGGTGGPMHVIGSAIASVWNKQLDGVNVTNSSTAASVVNCNMVNEDKAQLAFTMSDVALLASRGEEMFKQELLNMKGFAALHTNYVQLITKKDSGIKSVYDLKGKRVGVGAPGSGTEFNSRVILDAAGMSYDDLSKADFLSYAETCEQLGNNNIDAGFLTGGLPIAAISELAAVQEIEIIPIDTEIIEKLNEQYPIYFESEIPADLYKGVTEPVKTAALKNYIIVNKDLDEDLAYELVKNMYENWDQIKQSHSALKDVTPEMAVERMEIPLHPGVMKYYREKGLIE